MNQLTTSVFLLSIVLMSSSCVLLVGAGIGAGAVYALGEDSLERYLDAPISSVYDASRAQLGERGEITLGEIDSKEAYVAADLDKAKIEIFLTAVTEKTTRMVVKARKWHETAPDLAMAESVADRIAYRVE